MFRRTIPNDYGMLFAFETSRSVTVHTFFMRFPIDITFYSENDKVIKVVKNMKPWQWVKVDGVKKFMETKAQGERY